MGMKEMCDGCGKVVYEDKDKIGHTLLSFRSLNYNYTQKINNEKNTIVLNGSVIICDTCWALICAILKLKNDA